MPDELVESEVKDQKDQIVITIHETPEKELSLRSVDLFAPAMRVRLSTPTTDKIEHVFHSDVATLVREICSSASQAKQVINVPDFSVRFRGLAIRGYTLLVHTLEDGMRQFIVRLKRGIGNAMALFREFEEPEHGLHILGPIGARRSAGSQNAGRLFDQMLSHLYLPLVNLNTYLRSALDGGSNQDDRSLDSSVVQLKTKAEMLQFAFDRLISEMMLAKYAGDPETARAQQLPHINYAQEYAKERRSA
ncbi:MAG: hypothetical protein AAGH68_10125 [Pseudomonadota bacterium]